MAGDLFHVRGRAPESLTFGHPIRILSAGNHHPLLCELVDGRGDVGLWVVKPQRVVSKGVGRQEFFVVAELAGAEVCTWAGLRVPAIGLLRFPKRETAGVSTLSEGSESEKKEVGDLFALNRDRLAFCSRFLEGAVDVLPRVLKRRVRRPEVARAAIALLLADVFMLHDDRDIENSNCVFLGDDLVAIDHGLAFAGLDRPQETGKGLAARTVFSTTKRHVARLAARTIPSNPAWDEIVGSLESVSDTEIKALCRGWPPELDDDNEHSVRGLRRRMLVFLSTRREHVRALKTATVSSLGGPR
jgi:hypothetical protein